MVTSESIKMHIENTLPCELVRVEGDDGPWGTGTSGMQTVVSLVAVLSLITTTILLVNAL